MARDLPIPYHVENPSFTEHTVNPSKKTPGVVFNQRPRTKTTTKYPFVCSTIIDSDFGDAEYPKYINTIQEFKDEYGDTETESVSQALDFLSYSPSLLVQRCLGQDAFNATMDGFTLNKITSDEMFNDLDEEIFLEGKTIRYIARHPGKGGNKISIAMFTKEEIQENKYIYAGLKARDIISNLDIRDYCIVIFRKNIIKEVFVTPYNDLESINLSSRLVYVKFNRYNELLDGLYDGNEGYYSGNLLLNDGNTNRYSCIGDGNISIYGGDLSFYDGNECNIVSIHKFFGDSVINLDRGISHKPTRTDLEVSADDFNNILNFDIDLHLGNNVMLKRRDVVNIIGCPEGVSQAIDFKNAYEVSNQSTLSTAYFIYGIKRVNKTKRNFCGEYAGLRCSVVLKEGLGISTSKLSKPLSTKPQDLKTNPSTADITILYNNGINTVHNYKGTVSCNGEIINESTS